MYKHYIIMSSSYTEGTRVALDITDTGLLNAEAIERIIDDIKKICGKDVPLSTHLIETKSESWKSVVEYDPFFQDVIYSKSVKEFSEKVKTGRVLTGLDVATYILSKIKCTHLSLEKLVYFAYADYLCDYSCRLFEDQIYAFEYGPVVESVYNAYRQNSIKYFESSESSVDRDVQTGVKEMPAKSRILFAKDGIEKIRSIDKTVQRYCKYSPEVFVKLVNSQHSNWMYNSSKTCQPISDELIVEHHHAEFV